jgi:hypothetical protein
MEHTVNDRIRYICKNKNLTIKKISSILDIGVGTLSNMFSRGTNPSYELIVKISHAFPDVSLDWLITGSGQMLKTDRSANVNFGGRMNGGVVAGNVRDIKNIHIDHKDEKNHNSGGGYVGAVNGNNTFHIDAGNGKGLDYSLEILCAELKKLRENMELKDRYISGILEKYFEQNEQNVKIISGGLYRIDELIQIIDRQNQATQERADAAIEMLKGKSEK